MYTEKTRIARRIERKNRNTVVSFRGPRMDRHGIRAAIGAMTPVIATLLLCPWQDRATDPSRVDCGTPHGSTDTDVERREASP